MNKKYIFSFIFVIISYLFFLMMSDDYFQVKFVYENLILDFLLHGMIAYILFRISKNVFGFIFLYLSVFAIINLSNLLKISFYGAPIFIDDMFLLGELFSILEGSYFIALVFSIIIILWSTLYSVNIKKIFLIDVLLIIIIFTVPLLFYAKQVVAYTNKNFGYIHWDQNINYKKMGALHYLYQAYARYSIELPEIPKQKEVERVKKLLSSTDSNDVNQIKSEFKKRNVYIIVLESFWDASKLTEAGLSQDPFYPSFREIFEEQGISESLSPVFGGNTANAEFEILCGQPFNFNTGIIFTTSLHNEVECLPTILAENGYAVSAWHPNRSTFFNRLKAYKNIGLKERNFKEAFEFKDLNGQFLSDEALFSRVKKNLDDGNRPHLTYIMTITGHWPYSMNEKRERVISSSSKVPEVENYANSIYHTSKELMKFYKYIQEEDPDALVVITGDHLPFLGTNFAGYVESNVLKKSISEFDDKMLKTFLATPLIIIDGKNGKVNVGKVSMYEIPHIILQLLGNSKSSAMQYFRKKHTYSIRANHGYSLLLGDNGYIKKCDEKSNEKECIDTYQWLNNVNLLSTDMFIGEQYYK